MLAVREADCLRLERNDTRMISWMCNVTLNDGKPSLELRECSSFNSIRNCIRRGRLRWFAYVGRCGDDSAVKKCSDIVVEGQQRNCWP